MPQLSERRRPTPSGANGGIDPTLAREAHRRNRPPSGTSTEDGKPEIVFSTWQGTIHVLAPWAETELDRMADPSAARAFLPASISRALTALTITLHGHRATSGCAARRRVFPCWLTSTTTASRRSLQSAFDGNIYICCTHDGSFAERAGRCSCTPSARTPTTASCRRPPWATSTATAFPTSCPGSNEEVGAGGARGWRSSSTAAGPTPPGQLAVLQGLAHRPHVVPPLPPWSARASTAPRRIADFSGSGQPCKRSSPATAPAPTSFPPIRDAERVQQLPANQGPCYEETPDAGGRVPCTTAGAQVGVGSHEHLRRRLAGDPPRHDVPALQQPLPSAISIRTACRTSSRRAGASSLIGNITGGGSSARAGPQFLLGMWSGATGHAMYGAPVPTRGLRLPSQPLRRWPTSPGTTTPRSILGTGGYFVHAVDACGCEAPAWPKFTDGWIIATPAVGDIDGEPHAGGGDRDARRIPLRVAHEGHGHRRRAVGVVSPRQREHGELRRNLDQGVTRRATAPPIDCSKGAARLRQAAGGPAAQAGRVRVPDDQG